MREGVQTKDPSPTSRHEVRGEASAGNMDCERTMTKHQWLFFGAMALLVALILYLILCPPGCR
jgi:hypothetical protein